MLLLRALFGWLGIGYLDEMLRRRKLAAPTAHDRMMMRLELAVLCAVVVFVLAMGVGSAPGLFGLGAKAADVAWFICGLCAVVLVGCSVALGFLDSNAVRGGLPRRGGDSGTDAE